MKIAPSLATVAGTVFGFVLCCVAGRILSTADIYPHFLRLHRFIEQETSYYPTASQLIAVAHAQCPVNSGKVLVLIGGNSVLNGSGQHSSQLWSRALQSELGDQFKVINFAAPGAGVVDNGGVIFQALANEYPRSILVTNTEPGYYPAANESAYAYLFWDAFTKGLLPPDSKSTTRHREEHLSSDEAELVLGYHLNSHLYFNDLWTAVTFRYGSAVWSSWLKARSFGPRAALGDWYDARPPVKSTSDAFQKLMPGHLKSLRTRRPLLADRFHIGSDGQVLQTAESLAADKSAAGAMLPAPLRSRVLIWLTAYNPWFVERLTEEEQQRVKVSYGNAVELLGAAGYHTLSGIDGGFQPADFGDTVHLSPAGGGKLASAVAPVVREISAQFGQP